MSPASVFHHRAAHAVEYTPDASHAVSRPTTPGPLGTSGGGGDDASSSPVAGKSPARGNTQHAPDAAAAASDADDTVGDGTVSARGKHSGGMVASGGRSGSGSGLGGSGGGSGKANAPRIPARMMLSCLQDIFRELISAQPTVLVIEDAQEMDENSWQVLHALSELHLRCFVLLTQEPLAMDVWDDGEDDDVFGQVGAYP